MRTRYLVLLFSSFPLLASAQTVTLDNAGNTPGIGSTFLVNRHNQYIAPGPAGAAEFWSFTNLPTDEILTYQILDPSTYEPPYPEATHLITDGNDTLIYKINDQGMELLAEAVTFSIPLLGTADIHAAYSDGVIKLEYPTAYSTTWSDVLVGTYELDGTSVTRVGTITGNADGNGTVALPQGTYDDILRVHTFTNTTETASEGSGVRRLHEHTFYADWLKFPLLKITLDSISITTPFAITNVISRVEWLDTVSVGLMEAFEQGEAFGLWPTPATDVLNITLPAANGERTLAILRDLSGRTVREWTINAMGNSTVTVNDLPSGQYLLQVISTSGSLGVRKVIIR